MQAIQGLHHITAVAGDPQANVDFYERVLGQRLVKTTVNFDDPGTYHLYYGDEVGTPGTVMTFFPWAHVGPGRPGNGEAAEVTWAVTQGSLAWWAAHLAEAGVEVESVEARFGDEVLTFRDPDGMRLGLVATGDGSTEDAPIRTWTSGPIPAEHAIRGFHGVTLWVARAEPTAAVLTDQLGYVRIDADRDGGRGGGAEGHGPGERIRFRAASNDMGLFVDLVADGSRDRGRFGAGSIHHIAFRTVDDAEQLEYRGQLQDAGLAVSPVKDRQYFHSIYFREPGGVLFEVATDAPGFLYDEPVETLGRELKLPGWLESKREAIEMRLAPLRRYADVVQGGAT